MSSPTRCAPSSRKPSSRSARPFSLCKAFRIISGGLHYFRVHPGQWADRLRKADGKPGTDGLYLDHDTAQQTVWGLRVLREELLASKKSGFAADPKVEAELDRITALHVRGAKRDVVDRAAAESAGQESFRFANIDDAADRFAGTQASKRSVAAGSLESQNIGQHRGGARRVFDHQRDAVKAAHRVLGGNGAGAPCRLGFGARDADQRQAHAVGIGERQHGFAEALFRRLMSDAVLDEPVRPVADRACRHAECRLLRQANAAASRGRVLPRKECEDGAGMTDPVAVIEVIGAGIVEIHRLLDEAQADDTRIEIQVARSLA